MTNIAKKKIGKNISQEAWDYLFDLMSSADSSLELKECIDNLFSEAEQVMIEKRLAIVCLLKDGKSYKEVSRLADVSSATISSVKQGLKSRKADKKIVFNRQKIFIKNNKVVKNRKYHKEN